LDKSPPAPIAADLLAFRAAHSPAAIALIVHGAVANYAEVYAEFCKIAAALAERQEVVAARLIGVAHRHPGVHLLLLYALEALGIATLPFVQPADEGIEAALSYCDLLIADQPLERLARPVLLLTATWLTLALRRPAADPVLQSKRAIGPVNVFTTPGSTSAAKGVVFDHQRLDARIRARLWQYGLNASSCVLVGMPPSTSSAYLIAQAALRAGACICFADPHRPFDELQRWTHAILLPIHLRLLAEAAVGPAPARQLDVIVVGARCPDQIRVMARERLNAHVHEAYGTTETGWLAVMDDDHRGDVLPDVEVEIVNQQRTALSIGEVGEVRARSPEMASGYLDASLTAQRFDGGWYYTGDLARLIGPRRLELMGRTDAMLNFGGLKVSAEVIEETLAAASLASDLAVATRIDPAGIETLVIFLHQPKRTIEELTAVISHALGRNLGRITVMPIDRIPRSASGKVQRGALETLARALPHSNAGLP
jgi:acyl-CoA synthetase (AMP-forming)/AMP-acid ligase II